MNDYKDGEILIDTNILIYALYDNTEKYKKASETLIQIGRSGKGILSIQTLAESYWVMVYKRKPGLDPNLAKQILIDYAETWKIIEPSKETFLKAMDGVINYKLSFWDAMQWAIAFEYGVKSILTEDFNHGQIIEGVQIINPFKV